MIKRKRFEISLYDEDLQALDIFSKSLGVSRSEVVRFLIKNASLHKAPIEIAIRELRARLDEDIQCLMQRMGSCYGIAYKEKLQESCSRSFSKSSPDDYQHYDNLSIGAAQVEDISDDEMRECLRGL